MNTTFIYIGEKLYHFIAHVFQLNWRNSDNKQNISLYEANTWIDKLGATRSMPVKNIRLNWLKAR